MPFNKWLKHCKKYIPTTTPYLKIKKNESFFVYYGPDDTQRINYERATLVRYAMEKLPHMNDSEGGGDRLHRAGCLAYWQNLSFSWDPASIRLKELRMIPDTSLGLPYTYKCMDTTHLHKETSWGKEGQNLISNLWCIII